MDKKGSLTELQILNKCLRDYEYFDLQRAEHFLNSVHEISTIEGHNLLDGNSHDELIRDLRKKLTDKSCTNIIEQLSSYGFSCEHYTEEEIAKRISDKSFWTRLFRRRVKELISELERCIGLVSSRRSKYCGDITKKHFKLSEQKSEEFLERCFIQNLDGRKVSLKEISEHNVSNRRILFYEWITRVKGFDELAERHGHVSMMITLTCPAYMHASHSRSGELNKRYRGYSVKECQKYLNTVWRRIRAKLNHLGVTRYGMRVVEPHHDGTPHWHMILHCEPEQVNTLKEVFRHYALQDAPHEKGAKQRRIDFIDIDRKRGTSASYLAKYLAKNMTGIKSASCRQMGVETADCTRAWASAHNIRQFQQFGGPNVTVYRELRRLRDKHSEPILEQARLAADASEWAAYCEAVGGLGVSSRSQTIKPYYEQPQQLDKDTGELRPPGHPRNVNCYGEPLKKVVKGIQLAGKVLKTRTQHWTIETSPPQSGVSPPARAGCTGTGGYLGLV